MTTSTKVQVKCASKKQAANYHPELPYRYEIGLEVPYDQTSIYYQMSGGTMMTLNTINQDAADMFIVGNTYDLDISVPIADPAPAPASDPTPAPQTDPTAAPASDPTLTPARCNTSTGQRSNTGTSRAGPGS